jgi:hypothetical protein
MNAASVLWAIREGNSDLDAICSKLRMTESLVYRYVDDLIKLGLVERVLKEHPEKQRHGVGEMPPVPRPLREAPLKQTAQWDRIAAALGISLSNLVFERDEMRVRPYFGGPRAVPSLGAFVAMAFRPELRPVYDDHILPVMKGLKLEARRADDFFSVNSVMGDIWKAGHQCSENRNCRLHRSKPQCLLRNWFGSHCRQACRADQSVRG